MLVLEGRKLAGKTGHEAGRALLRQLVEACTGLPMSEVKKLPGGKPYFPESPIHFSISHTKNHVFVALSDRPIGIDAEELSRKVNPALAQKILSGEEYSQYAAAADKNTALLTFWVLKEAEAKCSGQGLQGYPNHTHFSLDDPRVRLQDGCLIAVIEEDDHAV